MKIRPSPGLFQHSPIPAPAVGVLIFELFGREFGTSQFALAKNQIYRRRRSRFQGSSTDQATSTTQVPVTHDHAEPGQAPNQAHAGTRRFRGTGAPPKKASR